MNRVGKFLSVEFLILCITIGVITTDTVGHNDETRKVILVEFRENVTLPCHPTALQNLTRDESDFEWVTDNDIPIFSNGSLSPFVYLNSPEPLYSVENYSLILRNIETFDITFTCRLTRLGVNYTYFIQEKRSKATSYERWTLPIEFTLPCSIDNQIDRSTAGISSVWLMRNTQQGSIEVISLNQRILLRNNTANFRVTEDRSLIIPNFTPNNRIQYECRISMRRTTAYYISGSDEDKKVPENPKVSLIKRSIAVAQGNDVTLNCSSADSQPDFVWIRNEENLLSIGDGLINSSDTANFKIDTDGRSLTIANFSSSLSGAYTCLSSTGENYVYNVTEQSNPGNEFSFDGTSLTKEPNFRTIAAEQGKYISLPCSLSSDEDESNFAWIRNNKEVLFINGHVVAGSKSDKLKIADDRRSLVFAEFSYLLIGVYECRSRTGKNYAYNVTISNTPIFKKQALFVEYGTRGTVLPCPAPNKNENAFSEWLLETTGAVQNSPDLLFLNKENFAFLSPTYYEINDDRSLVIKFMANYGVFTCRWSTGEQYVYNVTRESITLNNHTVWANQGENITLPCPLQDPRDRKYNVIQWASTIPNKSWQLRFTDGKTFHSPLPFEFLTYPDNIKLSDDKTSLIVLNITSNSEGNYFCYLTFSNTVHWYSVKLGGQ